MAQTVEEKKAWAKAYRAAHKDKMFVYNKLYYKANRQEILNQKKDYREINKTKTKDKVLRRDFGISLNEYNQMLTQQNNRCKICNKEETGKHQSGIVRRLAVDHCHTTGKIRGLLCTNCNQALGKFKDSEELLLNAINYLKENK